MPASPARLTTCARPSLHALEGREQSVKLLVAPDQRTGEAQSREPTGRLRLGERAQQPMHDHRLGLAAQSTAPAGSKAKRWRVSAWVDAATRMVPGAAAANRREAVFTVSPVTS